MQPLPVTATFRRHADMSKAKYIELPSQEFLNEILRYEPKTGRLFWKAREARHFKNEHAETNCIGWNKKYAGKEAFTACNERGYRVGAIEGRNYRAHRIIWMLVKGVDPGEFEIDHENHIQDDNRLENLRLADSAMQAKNLPLMKSNKSGFAGVSWNKTRNKWRATMYVNNKQVHIGRFDTKDEAIEARKAANIKYGFHENHGKAATG